MKTRLEYITEGEEEIVFRLYEQEGMTAKQLLAQQEKLVGDLEGEKCLLFPREIYYLEVVDGKVFAYLVDRVVTVNYSLEKIEQKLFEHGFVRASKSIVVNVHQIKSFQSMMGNRMIATMSNEEKVIISRHYAKNLREYLRENS